VPTVLTPVPLRASTTPPPVPSTATAPPAPYTPESATTGKLSSPGAPRARGVALAAAAPTGVTVAVAVALHLDVPDAVHELALFGHLAALVVGFGAVLAVDWVGLQWLRRRARIVDVLATASTLTVPIWLGLTGLIATGALLSPEPASPRTLTKLLLVAVAGVNGAYAHRLHPRLARAGEAPPLALLLRGVASTTVSQLCWWGATIIGFLNARS
jgi:hypothetical protein